MILDKYCFFLQYIPVCYGCVNMDRNMKGCLWSDFVWDKFRKNHSRLYFYEKRRRVWHFFQ